MHEVVLQLKRFVAIEQEVNYHLVQRVERGFKLLPNDRLLAQDMVMENFIRNHSRRIEVEELDDEFDSESDEDKPNRPATVFIEAADQVFQDNFEEKLQEARRDASVNITETYLMNPELEQGTSTLAVGPDWQIDPKDVERFERIGNGGFGEVYRGTWLGAPVAIKVVGTAQDPDGRLFHNELDIWFSLNHPHIVNLFGASDGKTRFFVCDLADVDKGHLGSSSKSFDKRNVWKMLYQTASALQCLHARGILHGDLNGDNVLIKMDNLVQLTDFGLSFVETGLQTKSLTTCALRWTAPECLRGERVTSMSDVYGLGMSIIQAISGDIPWPNRKINAVLRHELMENELPYKRPGGFSDIEWGLVRRMCLFEKEERLELPLVVKVLGEFAFDKLSNIRDRIFMSKMVHDWKLCDHAKEARKPSACIRHFQIPSISTA